MRALGLPRPTRLTAISLLATIALRDEGTDWHSGTQAAGYTTGHTGGAPFCPATVHVPRCFSLLLSLCVRVCVSLSLSLSLFRFSQQSVLTAITNNATADGFLSRTTPPLPLAVLSQPPPRMRLDCVPGRGILHTRCCKCLGGTVNLFPSHAGLRYGRQGLVLSLVRALGPASPRGHILYRAGAAMCYMATAIFLERFWNPHRPFRTSPYRA